MKNSFLFCVIFFLSICLSAQTTKRIPNKLNSGIATSTPILVKWVDHLKGDYSFANNWSYPIGVYKNQFGQLSCDGFCPYESYQMEDSTGRIMEDSLPSFYKLIDTSHQIHSILCEAWCYEWAGTDFIKVIRKGKDSFNCQTMCGIATHCSLQLEIHKDTCLATIDLNSIVSGGSAIYYCTDGYITIEKNSWEAGIMKAEFNFNFEHLERPSQPMFWKGKIYANIKNGD